MGTFLSNLRLTFAIPAMTIGALATAMLAVIGGLYLSLSGTVQRDTDAAVMTSTRVAAQILQVNLPSLDVVLDEHGEVTGLSAQRMPRFRTHDVIDTVSRVAGQGAAIYVFDPEVSPDFLVGSTSLVLSSGERAVDRAIPAGSALFDTLMAGSAVQVADQIEAKRYLMRYQPIATADGKVIGALLIAVDRAPLEAVLGQSMLVLGATALLALVLIALVALMVARGLIRPIPQLAKAMDAIAGGELDCEVPYLHVRNEVGAMARSVEIFRTNALEKAALDERARHHLAEAADHTGQLQAIGRSQIVAEFHLDGTVISANENFLRLLGYGAADVVGQPNALFLFNADPKSVSYIQFWTELAEGTFKSGEYRRQTRDGREVWIQSTFTPISDAEGRPYKVVQFATDVTARKQSVAAIGQGLKTLASGDLTHGPERESLEEFLSKLPGLWRAGEARPTHRKAPATPHTWRTRKDPFEEVWPEILLWLQADPDATAKTLMDRLQRAYPGRYPGGQLRTLRRRVREWRHVMARPLVHACVSPNRAVAEPIIVAAPGPE